MDVHKNSFFTRKLMHWHITYNQRQMPWKSEKDPYKIWLSEIILQQTRVEQGLDYYLRFIKAYPTVKKLAAAPEKNVFKLWEGLGYYTRCRNLIATAKFISENLHGRFPETYDDIIKLKGIGPYTASAIASFAYNLPYAVVDGNVMRVLARFFGINADVSGAEGKKIFSAIARDLLPTGKSALYNQAIMDFGATVCKPAQPLCTGCILAKNCYAYQHQQVNAFPVKAKKQPRRKRFFYYVVAEYRGSIYIRQRLQKDIWQNLHEFILVERKTAINADDLLETKEFKSIAGDAYKLKSISSVFRQVLTHQEISGLFIHIQLNKKINREDFEPVKKMSLVELAFPQFINQYLRSEETFLK